VVLELVEAVLDEELLQDRVDGGMPLSTRDLLGDVDVELTRSLSQPSTGIVAALL
jgi:hypothetical protein